MAIDATPEYVTVIVNRRIEGAAVGRPKSALDMIIAAVAEANDCVVVTDNEKDFVGLEIINPVRGSETW